MQLAVKNLGQTLAILSSIECHGCDVDQWRLLSFHGVVTPERNRATLLDLDNATRSDASCESVYVQPHFTLTPVGIVPKPTYSFTTAFSY